LRKRTKTMTKTGGDGAAACGERTEDEILGNGDEDERRKLRFLAYFINH